MSTFVTVELDRWGERGKIRAEKLEDGSQTVLGFRSNGNNKIVFDRSIFLDKFGFRVFISEYKGDTTFLLRAALAIVVKPRRPRGKWSTTPLRERPVKPSYNDAGLLLWPIDRTGVFADFPAQWDEIWAHFFIRDTLNYLRSPEAPEHCDLHTDNSELDNEY